MRRWGLGVGPGGLPISAGGLGIRDPLTSWSEARLADLITFQRLATVSVAVPEAIRVHPSQDLPRVLSTIATILGPNHDPLSRLGQ